MKQIRKQKATVKSAIGKKKVVKKTFKKQDTKSSARVLNAKKKDREKEG